MPIWRNKGKRDLKICPLGRPGSSWRKWHQNLMVNSEKLVKLVIGAAQFEIIQSANKFSNIQKGYKCNHNIMNKKPIINYIDTSPDYPEAKKYWEVVI